MKENDLMKRSEELERTLKLQIEQLKKDSEIWLKVGGAIVLIGLITYGVRKAKRNKKSKQKSWSEEVEQKGTRDWQKQRPKKPARKSFFSTLKNRLFLTLLSYGEVKLVDALNKRIKKNEK